jgi:uncharacterized protein YbjT (DUF2867 family)
MRSRMVTEPIDTVFCCLGTTRREAGSKEAFICRLHAGGRYGANRVTLGARHMLVVSALGANARSPFFYNRVKGEMENALMKQEWERLTIVRPSMLVGTAKTSY